MAHTTDAMANLPRYKSTDYTVIVAIDFGSTYSGYAFSTKGNPREVKMNDPWGYEMGVNTWKTPSAVLTNNKKEFVAFGYQAKSQYRGSKEKRHHKYYIYDNCFKMKLYQAETLEMEIESNDGKQQIPLKDLIKMSLKYLYGHFLSGLARAYQRVDEHLIRVMLTVPAIWNHSANEFMKTIATEAGIGLDRLELTLEPEAASLHCRTLTPFEVTARRPVTMQLSKDTAYMVVDCGGGTIDIAVHKVEDEDSIQELAYSHGGPWGGNKINEQFEVLFAEILGVDFLRKYKNSYPLDWFRIYSEFEYIKRTLNTDQTEYTILLPFSIIDFYNRSGIVRKRDIEKKIKSSKIEGVEYVNGRLFLSTNTVKKLFKQTIDEVVKIVNEILKYARLCNLKFIFMVGAFSDSNQLFERIQAVVNEKFHDIHVIRPQDAAIAVLKGAVYYGHNQAAIKHSNSQLLYGDSVRWSHLDSTMQSLRF